MPTNLSAFLGSTFIGGQGVQGTQGPQGSQGLQGTQGSQGLQGTQGAQGPQGLQGAQGAQGPQGSQGLQGTQGLQGLQGTIGVTGPITASDDTTTVLLYPTLVTGITAQNPKIGLTGQFAYNASTGNLGIGTTNPGSSRLSVVGNVAINGIVSFASTTAQFISSDVRFTDQDLILNLGPTVTSSDATADSAGIAVASTEGNPLVSLKITANETNPDTYKKWMWFKNNAAGLGTDAWLANYAIGIGSTQFPTGTRLAAGNVQITQNDITTVRNVYATGNVGVGSTQPSAYLNIAGGTASANTSPLKIGAGTTLTTPETGAVEYDGVRFYATSDTLSGRGFVESTQIYRLSANGSAIGPGISSFFGPTGTAIGLSSAGVYRLEAYCYFTKTTANTVTFTLTTSQTPVNVNGILRYGAIAGGTATGAANQIALFNSTATAAAFGITGSLATGVNHAINIESIIEANATLNSTLRIDVTSTTGTVTPLRGSYFILTRLPLNNQGVFTTV